MNPLIAQVLQQIFLLPADTQYIHIKLVTKARPLYRLVYQIGGKHRTHCGHAAYVAGIGKDRGFRIHFEQSGQ